MSPRTIQLQISIPKDVLSQLPAEHYDGPITVVDKKEDVAKAVDSLCKSKIIGFDTETKPSFKKGQSNTLSPIQLCTRKECFLFRVNMTGVTPELINLLQDAGKIKVGLSLHDDFHNLAKICDLKPEGFIDLQQYVKRVGIIDNSLTRIYGIVFGRRISKGQRLTNWEAPELTQPQQAYAALDAMACVRVYDAISKRKFIPKDSPYIVHEQSAPAHTTDDSESAD